MVLLFKRWSRVFALAAVATIAMPPLMAQTTFTLQYEGAAFVDNPLCGMFTNPFVACLEGHLTMTFVVEGQLPVSRRSTFWLACCF
jgi:hypothetical protein